MINVYIHVYDFSGQIPMTKEIQILGLINRFANWVCLITHVGEEKGNAVDEFFLNSQYLYLIYIHIFHKQSNQKSNLNSRVCLYVVWINKLSSASFQQQQ